MGLGKSLSMVSLIATDWSKHGKVDPTLLIVPSSLLRTWEEELEKHLHPQTLRCWRHHGPKRFDTIDPMLAYDIVLTTYDVVAMEWRQLIKKLQPLYCHDWNRIVLDEGKW